MPATYTKLKSGEWGVRVEGARPTSGVQIIVTKKDGSTKTETIDQVLWSGNGAFLCSVRRSEQPARTPAVDYDRRSRSGRCRGCGGPVVNAPHHRAMGGYCGRCAFDEFDG